MLIFFKLFEVFLIFDCKGCLSTYITYTASANMGHHIFPVSLLVPVGRYLGILVTPAGKKPSRLFLKTTWERLKEGWVDLGRVNQKAAVKSFVNV